MGWIFFLLWIILIAAFPNYSWQITILIVILYIALSIVTDLIRKAWLRRAENKKYLTMLRLLTPKLQKLDIRVYQEELAIFEKLYGTVNKPYRVVFQDKNGRAINICSKCGSYMRIVKGRKGPFLGCSNYPNCRSIKNFGEILKIEI